jgi:hypothetical protein
MTKLLLIVPVLLVSVLATGCNLQSSTASPGQEFTLRPGQELVVQGETLSIKFIDVQGDSR